MKFTFLMILLGFNISTSWMQVILVGPDDQELQAGERLVLSCSGQNNEDATMPLRVNWFFTSFDSQSPQRLYTIDDPQVNEIRLPNNITNSTFIIDRVMVTDGGVYACHVSNRDGILPVEQSATVIVLFTPQIQFTVSPNPVLEMGNPLLTCVVTAEPLANFSEIVRILPDGREEQVANISNPMGVREFQMTYTFMNVRFPRDDGAVFECRSSNANGPEAESITIIVQAPPNEINHANDVTAQLTNLRAVNVTWSVPSANNAPILSYTLMFCARLEAGCVEGTFTNVTLRVESEQLIILDGNQLRYTFNEIIGIDREYEVVIRARNSVGQQTSPMFGGGFRFNSASPDDGRVANVNFIPSTRIIILTWNLPPLALATNNLNVSFNVTFFSASDPLNILSVAVEYNPMQLEQGVSVDLMIADSSSHTFQIVALYTNPYLLSSQAYLTGVRTLANDATLLTGPEAVVSNDVSPEDVLTISWPPPMNINFLVAYLISYTTSPVRSRRQTSSPVHVEVPAGMTSTTLPFTPFMNFTVDVDAVYAPPPDGTRVVINLLPPTTFITPQIASSPPLNVMAMNESVIKVRLTWEAPTSPNGVIIGYRIIGSTGQMDFGARVEANILTYLSLALIPNTEYTFRVAAITGAGDGMFSTAIVIQTNFSVVQPIISNTTVGDSGSPSFTIIMHPFSDDLGEVGVFKVVVVRGSRVEPRDISDNSLAPFGISQFNYYVAYVGDAHSLIPTQSMIIIGDNSVTTDDRGTNFTNPPPELGEDYYVFIRLYSAVDVSIFVDSELTDVLRVESPDTVTPTSPDSDDPPTSTDADDLPTSPDAELDDPPTSTSRGAPQLVPVIPLLLNIVTSSSLIFHGE